MKYPILFLFVALVLASCGPKSLVECQEVCAECVERYPELQDSATKVVEVPYYIEKIDTVTTAVVSVDSSLIDSLIELAASGAAEPHQVADEVVRIVYKEIERDTAYLYQDSIEAMAYIKGGKLYLKLLRYPQQRTASAEVKTGGINACPSWQWYDWALLALSILVGVWLLVQLKKAFG